VLEMLNNKVWLDGDSVEITGAGPVSDDVIVTTCSEPLTTEKILAP
jgi:hypothetical protein